MKWESKIQSLVRAALFVALVADATIYISPAQAAYGNYRLVENWAQLPQGIKWGQATGVDIDSHGTIYVFHRSETMPIMAFDSKGKFLRAWGQNLFKTTHSLRTDRDDNVWVTDRGSHQIFKFDSYGKALMTLGQKDRAGDNSSTESFNGPTDIVIAQQGNVFIADGESTNTRVVKYSRDGKFIKYWGGKGSGPGQFDQPHSIAMDSKGRIYVADRSNNRIQIFDQDGKFITQWTNLGSPWGLFITKRGLLYVVDGSQNNCLLIADTKDGKIIDRIDGLSNPTAVAVDKNGAIYIAEVNGTSVKKFVKK